MLRLFLDGNGLALIVEFYDTEALRIVYVIAEYGCALFLGSCRAQALL